MNQRLNELMLEAGYAAPELATRARLLAVLIIEECMEVSDRKILDSYGDQLKPSTLIKEYFGVQ